MKTRITTLIFVLVLAVCDQATAQKYPPLEVVRTYPLDRATNVPLDAHVAFEFSTPVVKVGFSPSPYFACSSKGQPTPLPPSTTFTCRPTQLLQKATTYTITIKSATDINGTTLAAPYSWAFSTGEPQPPPMTMPDLRPEPNTTNACIYENCMYKVGVLNGSSAAAGPFKLRVFYDNGNAHELNVDGLAAHTSRTFWFPAAWGCVAFDFGFAIRVDAANEVKETNESNNTASRYCYLE